MDVDGCHFRVIFSGEFISILKNAIHCKKCARTQALLGTSGSCLWMSFWGNFRLRIYSHHGQSAIRSKKCARTQHFQALVRIFMHTYTLFLKWMLMGVIFGLFFWSIHFYTKKCNQLQKVRAHTSTFRHLCAFSYETYTFPSGSC